MTAIGPGDWVELFSFYRGRGLPSNSGLTLGMLFQVERIVEVDDLEGGVVDGAWLAGYHWPHSAVRPACPLECLRPIYRPKADLVERLMQPVDESVRETA